MASREGGGDGGEGGGITRSHIKRRGSSGGHNSNVFMMYTADSVRCVVVSCRKLCRNCDTNPQKNKLPKEQEHEPKELKRQQISRSWGPNYEWSTQCTLRYSTQCSVLSRRRALFNAMPTHSGCSGERTRTGRSTSTSSLLPASQNRINMLAGIAQMLSHIQIRVAIGGQQGVCFDRYLLCNISRGA